jgi:outer membrane receptor for ferrienterochelin and colicin
MKQLIPCVSLVAVLVSPGVSAAQNPINPARMSEMSLEQLLDLDITTASRVRETAGEAPATVYVISKRDIRARGYSTLSDVLKDLPGMETVEHYYSEQGTLVPVRGVVGNNKIVLLVNGMRVNPPGGEELMIRSDVSVRFAEQIEIIYGPGSTLYGQDAISAVINLKTANPETQHVEVLGALGDANSQEASSSFGLKLRDSSEGATSLMGNVSFQRSDLADFRSEFPEWWKKYSDFLAPIGRSTKPVRGDFGYNAFFRLDAPHASLQAWMRESERSTAEGSGEGGATPVLWFVDEAKWRDRSLVVEGQQALDLSDRVALRSILTFNRYEVDRSSRYVFPVGGDLYLEDFKYGVGTGVSIEEKVDYTVSQATRFVAGMVATRYDIVPKVSVLGGADPAADIVTQAGTLTYYTRPNDPSSAVNLNRAENLKYYNVGFYAEGARSFARHFKVISGVRVDRNSRFTDVPISPRAAFIYSGFTQRLSVKYIFSRAYVAPAPYFGHNVFDNGVQLSAPNPALGPERATSNEVNVVWQGGHLLASASVYLSRQSDLLITAQSESPETVLEQRVYVNPDGTGVRLVRHSINLGSGRAAGLDLSSRYNLKTLSLWASYSFVDVSKTVGTRASGLDQISGHNVRAGGTWSILPTLSVTPSLVLRSTPAGLTGNYAIPGANLKTPYEVNVNGLYSVRNNWDAFVTIRNLTDHQYGLRGVAGPALQEPFAFSTGVRFRR